MVMWVNLFGLSLCRPGSRTTFPRPGRRCSRQRENVCGERGADLRLLDGLDHLGAYRAVFRLARSAGRDAGERHRGTGRGTRVQRPRATRLLNDLVALQADRTFDYSGRTETGEQRFLSGECPIFLSSSGFYGAVKSGAKFDFAATTMPYYPDIPNAPQNSIIGGASLWVMGGRNARQYAGVARFFAFLSDVDRQVRLHKESGYLPITRAALREIRASGFYASVPSLEVPLLEITNRPPTINSRGLRLGNLVQIRDAWAEEIEAALKRQKSAKDALDAAVDARQCAAPALRERTDTLTCWRCRIRSSPGSQRSFSRAPACRVRSWRSGSERSRRRFSPSSTHLSPARPSLRRRSRA